jgi:cytosine/adenosine deaminase-related metal-dependent hydrolase
MTRAAEQILEEFEALPDGERAALLTELARRVALAPHDGPSDEDLLRAADELFRDLDRRERT